MLGLFKIEKTLFDIPVNSLEDYFYKVCMENKKEMKRYLGGKNKSYIAIGRKSLLIYNNGAYYRLLIKDGKFKIYYAQSNKSLKYNIETKFKELKFIHIKDYGLKLNNYKFSTIRAIQDFILLILPHSKYHPIRRVI